jgi:hypothetical protein
MIILLCGILKNKTMIKDTKQLDKLIEDRVDKNIKNFAESIAEQIEIFLKDNGEKRPNRFDQVQEWNDGMPLSYTPISINKFCIGLQFSISKAVKDKMIERDTKFLLDKMNSLL